MIRWLPFNDRRNPFFDVWEIIIDGVMSIWAYECLCVRRFPDLRRRMIARHCIPIEFNLEIVSD